MLAWEPLEAGDPAEVGPYQVLARLGAGGMGRVYLARSAAGRWVAVKTIRPEFTTVGEFRRRFAHEAQAAARVSGVFTASVVDSDPGARVPWIATAYVPAPSLKRLIKTCGPQPADTVMWLGAGIAEALQSIHAVGVVHRDLKPSNILLDEHGPRVIDFGVVHAEGTYVSTGGTAAIGTPGYMSPEQAYGNVPVTTASDVYALGLTLICLATGQHELPVHAPTELDEPLRGIVERCLRRDARHRPEPAEVIRLLAAEVDLVAHDNARGWLGDQEWELVRAFRDAPMPAMPEQRTQTVPPPPRVPPGMAGPGMAGPGAAGPGAMPGAAPQVVAPPGVVPPGPTGQHPVVPPVPTGHHPVVAGPTGHHPAAPAPPAVTGQMPVPPGARPQAGPPPVAHPHAARPQAAVPPEPPEARSKRYAAARAYVPPQSSSEHATIAHYDRACRLLHDGHVSDAADAFRQATQVAGQVFGPWHAYAVCSLLGSIHAAGRLGWAAAARDQAFSAAQGAFRALGADHPFTLLLRGEHAYWLGHSGDVPGAAEATGHLAGDYLRTMGELAADTLSVRAEWAMWIAKAGDVDRGVRHFERLVGDCRTALGEDSLVTLDVKNAFAHWIGVQGDAARAAHLYTLLVGETQSSQGAGSAYATSVRARLEYWTPRG
ncbi:protein kinase domain-containing protein [Yinghuangia sp. YIM S09857]|uniref:protein kinase domain-containing protein n=1 Tax=Yinghuangia sp. YIM S09857 TaxID=3436929 RepID=UPI003F5345F8